MRKEIYLTEQELNELKDDIKFREKVLVNLKQLNGIPKKVWQLDIWVKIHWFFITIIIGFLAFRTWTK